MNYTLIVNVYTLICQTIKSSHLQGQDLKKTLTAHVIYFFSYRIFGNKYVLLLKPEQTRKINKFLNSLILFFESHLSRNWEKNQQFKPVRSNSGQ